MDKLKKRDVILIGILLIIGILGLFWFFFGTRDQGVGVEIAVDGSVYGVYPLDQDVQIEIEAQGQHGNTLTISQGMASMTWADCPDKLCVHQASISRAGETIVCLPHRVTVTVLGNQSSELDGMAR